MGCEPGLPGFLGLQIGTLLPASCWCRWQLLDSSLSLRHPRGRFYSRSRIGRARLEVRGIPLKCLSERALMFRLRRKMELDRLQCTNSFTCMSSLEQMPPPHMIYLSYDHICCGRRGRVYDCPRLSCCSCQCWYIRPCFVLVASNFSHHAKIATFPALIVLCVLRIPAMKSCCSCFHAFITSILATLSQYLRTKSAGECTLLLPPHQFPQAPPTRACGVHHSNSCSTHPQRYNRGWGDSLMGLLVILHLVQSTATACFDGQT